MAEIPLLAQPREQQGSAPSRRLREQGRIPAVVYGRSLDPICVDVDARDLRVALSSEAGVNALFDLAIDGQHHLAIARALQRHPVRQSISHVDFQVVRRDEVVPAEVPVNLVGEATLVSRGDGSIEHLVQTIHVRAIPTNIPVSFEVDVNELEIGDSIRVSDLSVPDGVTIEADPETAIVIAHPPRAVGEGTAEAVEGEGGGASESVSSASESSSDNSADAS